MIRAVIFDLDGVLVHTDQYHYDAWKALADRLGFPCPPSVMDRLRGLSRMDSLDIVLGSGGMAYSPEEKAALAAEKNEHYVSRIRRMGPADVDPDVRETLEALRARGLALAVGSSSKNAGLILERTGLGPCFDAVADGTCVTRAKPDPEVFLKAVELLGVAPGEAVVVEDAAAGIRAAKAGGFRAAALGGDAAGHPLADWTLGKLSDLLELVSGGLQPPVQVLK